MEKAYADEDRSANSISAANDLTSLAPKYINIFRGQLLVCVVGYWGFGKPPQTR